MKKLLTLVLLVSISLGASAQLKVFPTYVGIGGNRITLKPANPGPEIGGSDGSRWSTISFWHSQSGWNKLLAKRYKTISDIAFKTNLIPLDSASQILRQINTYSYNFIEDSCVSPKKEYGIVAQELVEYIPDIVDTINGHLCVDYDELIPFLIKGFNEQQAIIDSCQIRIADLEATISNLQFQIQGIKSILREIFMNKED